MKSFLLFLLLAFAGNAIASSVATTPEQAKWKEDIASRATTQKTTTTTITPIMVDTPHGSIHWGNIYSNKRLSNGRRLQTPGEGFGNDPNACSTDGKWFTCNAPNVLQQGDNLTQVENLIQCLLDDAGPFDFQAKPETCTCHARLTDGATGQVRMCACGVCPYGRAQAVALDCSMVEDNPFVAGPCTSLDCDGRCNGTGAAVVNQPTPAPVTDDDDLEEGSSDGSGAMEEYGFFRILLGLMIGTVVSFVSVYGMM